MKSMYVKKRILAFLLSTALVFGQSGIVMAAETGSGADSESVVVVEEIQEEETNQEEESPASEESQEPVETPEETTAPESGEETEEEVSEETPEESASPEATEVPEAEPTQSPEAEMTPEPVASPEVTEVPDVSESPDASASPETSATPEASPSETPSESPSALPTESPSALPSATPVEEPLFTGLADGLTLSSEDMVSKEDLGQHMGEMKSLNEGVDYVENEILVSADTLEEAEAYAAAFNGTLRKYNTPVAVITLNADKERTQVSVADAVTASADMNMMLPAAWPNFYYYLDTEVEEVVDAETVEVEEGAEAIGEVEDTSAEIDVAYSDPYLNQNNASYQWYHSVIGSKEAWNAGYIGTGVKVAVIDTGLLAGHEDVTATQINAGAGTGDSNGHGTHVAGIIGAKGGNSKGGVGVAPGATLISIRVMDSTGALPTDLIIDGVYAAVNNGANIINMSLGGTGYSGLFQSAITYAYNSGVAVFCAAGNDATNSAHYPAAYKNAIGVAAVDKDNYVSSFSNYGSYVRYSAPGVGIYSTYKSSTTSYYCMDGTSQASPVVAGQAAVILSSGKVAGTGKTKVDNLLKLMDASCVKAQGKGTGKGVVSLSKALGLSTVMTKPNKPTFGTKSGTTFSATSAGIVLKAENGMNIYYSTDGKNVTYKNGVASANASVCTTGTSVTIGGKASVTIKAIAVNPNNGLVSSQVSATYKFKPIASGVTITSPTGTNIVAKGKSLKLTGTVTPAYAKDKSLQWSVVNSPAGISVKNGTVTVNAKKAVAGTYTIKAVAKNAAGKYAGASTTYQIKVVEAGNPIATIKATPSTKITVKNGASAAVTIDATRKDKTKASAANNMKWTSANTAVATVAVSGNTVTVTGKGAGKVNITGVATDGSGKKITLAVTVTQPVTSISITGSTLLAAGKSTTLKATVAPANATNKKVKWSMVTNTKNVTVSSSGKVTAKAAAAAGNYTVRATAADGSGKYKDYVVTVTAGKMTSLKLDKKTADIFRVTNKYGAATSATIKVTTAGTGNLTSWEVTSSNPGVVYIDAVTSTSFKVIATGKATGSSTITVKSADGSNLKATCKVTVNNPTSALHISPEKNRSLYLANGKSMKMTATLENGLGKVSSKAKKLSWTSSNPAAISVDQSGKVKALSGNGQNVTITARATDGSGVYASYTLIACGATTSLYMGGYSWWNWDVIDLDPSVYYYYPITCVSKNGYASYDVAATVNKDGLSATFREINGSWCLCLTGNKKGTYKVTLSMLDGSSAKKVYRIDVK